MSKSSLTIDNLTVEPGQRVTHVFHVPVGEHSVAVPVIAVNGSIVGPRVAVTAGIHGAEYVGIEAARRLGMALDPAETAGCVIVAPVANSAAFHARSIYTSALDAHNLNRVFPGDPGGSPSQRLAAWLFTRVIGPSDAYIDMHGGDMIEALVPFVLYQQTADANVDERARAMALATGIPRVIAGTTSGSTYAAAAAAGIPAILAEIGGQGLWDDALVEDHVASTRQVLQHLQVLPGTPATAPEPRTYHTFTWLRADVAGLFHPRVAVGDSVQEGDHVGSIVDYFGSEVQHLQAPTSGEILFLVTSLAMNEGDPLLAIGK